MSGAPLSTHGVVIAECVECGQEFTQLGHFTRVHGHAVCRDSDECAAGALRLPALHRGGLVAEQPRLTRRRAS